MRSLADNAAPSAPALDSASVPAPSFAGEPRELFRLTGGVCGYRAGAPVLSGIDFHVDAGEVVCLLGPNGVGKSTLFKSILRLIPLLGGTATFLGEDMAGWPIERTAQAIGYVPQTTSLAFDFTAFDMVLLGRTSRVGAFGEPTSEDEDIALSAARRLGIEHLMGRSFQELSGGEQQLVIVARALAQQPRMLVMDEPTAALDFGNQLHVLESVMQLRDEGLGIVMATHSPDHALAYANRAVLLSGAGVYADGSPEEVVTERALRDLYGISSKIIGTGVASPYFEGREVRTVVALGKLRET